MASSEIVWPFQLIGAGPAYWNRSCAGGLQQRVKKKNTQMHL